MQQLSGPHLFQRLELEAQIFSIGGRRFPQQYVAFYVTYSFSVCTAKLLLAVLLGVRVLARVNPERALLTGAVAPALAMLGLPALPPEGSIP